MLGAQRRWDARRTPPHPTTPPTLSAGAGSLEARSRHSSYPAGNQEDEEAEEEEPSPFRGRSRSAPPNLWAAQRYGRELRRMSDEFDGSFKVSAAPAKGRASPRACRDLYPRSLPTWLSCPNSMACRDLQSRDSFLPEPQNMLGSVVQAPLQNSKAFGVPKSVEREE